MTRTRSAPPTRSSISAPARACMAARSMAQGTLKDILEGQEQPDRRLPQRHAARSRCRKTRRKGNGKKLTVHGARANNLKNVTASASRSAPSPASPACRASGKSSFTIDTLYAAAARALNGARVIAGAHDKITGLEHCDKVIDIDQSPIGRTPRSNPATYTGAFTNIRDWFAGLPEVRRARLQARPVQLQRQGRALRNVQRRRPDQDRDALPARRLCDLRGMQRQTLQPRNAGGEVQGPVASPTCST